MFNQDHEEEMPREEEEEMTSEEKEYCLEQLRAYLHGSQLRDSVVIHRDVNDGRLTAERYCGVPPVKADGSEEILWTWENGDYDGAGDIDEAVKDQYGPGHPWLLEDSDEWTESQQEQYDAWTEDAIVERERQRCFDPS